MLAIQKTVRLIGAQLRGLPATAKLLIASLMVILAMTLLFVAMFAGGSKMIPLAAEQLTPEIKTKAANLLRASDIRFEDRGGQLYVPSDQKYFVLAQLTDNGVIGGDQIDFLKLVEQDSPFMTRESGQKKWLGAKMKVLEKMISQLAGIKSAMVVIDEPHGMPGIGRTMIPPSATVTVTTSSGLSQHQIDAIAKAVAKAQAGMKVEDVAIIDATAGRSYTGRNDDALGAGRHLEVKLETEKVVRETIENALGIPGARVAVNAIVDTRKEEIRSRKVEDPKVGPLGESTDTLNSTSTTSGGEAGVRPNAGATLAQDSRSGSQMTREKSESKTVPAFPTQDSAVTDNKGYAVQINATVGIPKSYFVHVFQEQQPDPNAQPDAAALTTLVQSETTQIKSNLLPLIQTAALPGVVPGELAVYMYYDTAATGPGIMTAPSIAGSAGGGGEGLGFLSAGDGLVKTIGLAGLALLSLFMMFVMVRKASVREELPSAAELVGIPPALDGTDSDLVGEADEATPALEGLELDDNELKNQQMLSQINEMVSKTPNEAAALVRKWLRVDM